VTEYVILKATNEPGTIFAIAGEQKAASAETAIRKWAAEEETLEGEENEEAPAPIYAAVPKRSWTAAKIESQITTVVKVTAL
jgi:hypothetical protein